MAELDGVRGMAIVTVLLWHCFYLTPDSTAAVIYNRFAGLGWLGVDLFFVLSGYLITGILLADRQRPDFFRRFYWRRALRIFPAYYFTLLMILLFVPLLHPEVRSGKAIEQWPWFLLYLQNWGMALNVGKY
ncbi:MAG TPA: acyltransferase, partial [Fontimonas sp.]